MPKQPASVPSYKLNKTQAAKDSIVFGAIMAGVKASKKRLKPLNQGLPAMETRNAMCAVGAGLLGVHKARQSDILTRSYQKTNRGSSDLKHKLVPLVRFATVMEVSENYACGVNDGFEGSKVAKSFYGEVDMDSLDYERGWHVGQAVAIESGF